MVETMPTRDSPNLMIRLEPEHKDALRELAAAEGVDMTAIVRPLILKRLGREDAVEAPKKRPQRLVSVAR